MAVAANGLRLLYELQHKEPPEAEYDEATYGALKPAYERCLQENGGQPDEPGTQPES